jgi:hypothetical protein
MPEPTAAVTHPVLQRLQRRGTEPVGVIDVLKPQSLYTRTPGWMQARSQMLDQLQQRYGRVDTLAAQATDLALVNLPVAKAAIPSQTPGMATVASGSATFIQRHPNEAAPSIERNTPLLGRTASPSPGNVPAMQDSVPTPAAAHEILQSSVLAQRLQRRSTEPVGMIDGRQPETDYPRTPGWTRARSEMLDQLQLRYGSNGETMPTQSSSAIATPTPAQSRVETLRTMATTAPTAVTFSASDATGLPSQTFRVSRKPMIKAAPSDAIATLPTATPKPAFPTTEPNTIAEAKSNPSLAGGLFSTTPTKAEPPPQSLVLPKRIGIPIQTGENFSDRNPHPLPEPVHQISATGTNAPLRLQKAASHKPDEPKGNTEDVGAREHGDAGKIVAQLSLSSSLPLVKPLSTSRLPVQRLSQESVQVENRRSPQKISEITPSNQLAVAAEIPTTVSHLSPSHIIWRTHSNSSPTGGSLSTATNGRGQTLPLTGHPISSTRSAIARQMTTTTNSAAEPTATSSHETIPSAATPVPTAGGEMNLAQIAEQVSRLLHRKLTVERERRGIGRWH